MKNTLYKIGAGIAAFGALASKAFAQTPAYTVNSTVQTSITDLLSSMVASVFSIIPVAVGIVGTLAVTLFAIRWLYGFARGKMHG